MTTKTNKTSIPGDKLNLYDKLIASNPDVERKGATMPYSSFNGHMFTFLSATGILAIRLPENERNNFIKKYNTSLMESHGVVMKEYVTVPENLLKNTDELKKYLDISFAYVKTLKPKPTTKKI